MSFLPNIIWSINLFCRSITLQDQLNKLTDGDGNVPEKVQKYFVVSWKIYKLHSLVKSLLSLRPMRIVTIYFLNIANWFHVLTHQTHIYPLMQSDLCFYTSIILTLSSIHTGVLYAVCQLVSLNIFAYPKYDNLLCKADQCERG